MIRNTLLVSLPVKPSSSIIWRVVGLASPGPLEDRWTGGHQRSETLLRFY